MYFKLRVLWRDVEQFRIIPGFYTKCRSEERETEWQMNVRREFLLAEFWGQKPLYTPVPYM